MVPAFLPASNFAYCQEKSLDKLMDLSLEELADVVVITPSKTSQKLKEIPGTVRVITARDISARGYLTLEDALSDLPGMQFRNILGFNSYVFMRGVPNQNNLILVMIDGVQVNELNSGGFYGGGQYNLSNVDRIEVVYGPASAMYGTNAVSGVINIITKSAKDNRGLRVSTMAGGFDTRQHDLTYGFYDEKNDVDLNVSAMFKKSEKADLRGAQGDGNWSDTMENFEDDSAFDAKLRSKRFTFGLNYQDKQASYVTKDRTRGTLFQDFGTNWHIRFLNAYAKYDYQKSDRWSWHSMLYYRNATVEDDTRPLISLASAGDPGYQERWYRPNHLAGLENRLNCELGPRLSLILGTVSERESLSAAFSKTRSGGQFVAAQEPPEPRMLDNSLTSVYAQFQWRINRPLSFTAGVRRDDSDVYGKVVTPRLGLVYDKDKFNAKLLYAEAYRAPKPWDYQDGLGNPDLTPEAMRSMELAFGYSFTDRVHGGLSVYRNALSNGLTRENTGAGSRWTNVGRIETTGFEGELEYKKNRWRSYLNYTYTDSATAEGAEVPEVSGHSANAGVQYCFTDRLKLDVRGQYLGKRKNTQPAGAANDTWIDGAFVFHGTLSLANCRGYDLQLAARNIFNKEYYHTSNTSVSMYRQPQSLVTLKVSRQF
jgi:outer membrane cobalamin receptor